MTFEGARKNLGPLHSKTDAIVLDRRKSGLRNAGAFRELVLAQPLQLADMRTDSPTETFSRFFAGRKSAITASDNHAQ